MRCRDGPVPSPHRRRWTLEIDEAHGFTERGVRRPFSRLRGGDAESGVVIVPQGTRRPSRGRLSRRRLVPA